MLSAKKSAGVCRIGLVSSYPVRSAGLNVDAHAVGRMDRETGMDEPATAVQC
jgi:hypothetical protein